MTIDGVCPLAHESRNVARSRSPLTAPQLNCAPRVRSLLTGPRSATRLVMQVMETFSVSTPSFFAAGTAEGADTANDEQKRGDDSQGAAAH